MIGDRIMKATDFSFGIFLFEEDFVGKLLILAFEDVVRFLKLGKVGLILVRFIFGLLKFVMKGGDLFEELLIFLTYLNTTVFDL